MGDRMENMALPLMDESDWQKKMKQKKRSKKMEFVGWGSKPLIDFLESIGIDTREPLLQYDVTAVINEYIHKNKLLDARKKKKVLCDAKLQSVFGKKSVNRNKIYELLEPHFAENHEDSEEDSDKDEFGVQLEVMEKNVSKSCKRQRKWGSERTHRKDETLEAPRSCFASVNVKNINLVYLRKSLIEDLLKQPEIFEGKVLGSFVRVKCDPKDYFQKNSHQLLQVKGVKMTSKIGDADSEILLQVSNLNEDIRISMLSDDDFSEEECEDLNQRVKDGLLKRPTVLGLEQKARHLHEDITKHRIMREIAQLQNLIDRANEKGWRAQLCEYLERRLLLQTPSEQLRLLQKVPEVIADEIEQKDTSQDSSKVTKQGHDSSLKTILLGASETTVVDFAKNGTTSYLTFDRIDAAGIGGAINENAASEIISSNYAGLKDVTEDIIGSAAEKEEEKQHSGAFIPEEKQHQSDIVVQEETSNVLVHEKPHQSAANVAEKSQEVGKESIRKTCHDETKGNVGLLNGQKISNVQIIDLSDTDDDPSDTTANQILEDPESFIWHYVDPFGDTQGPFPMSMLKRWNDFHYFGPGFKVWKTGQNQEAAILLTDALRSMFRKTG